MKVAVAHYAINVPLGQCKLKIMQIDSFYCNHNLVNCSCYGGAISDANFGHFGQLDGVPLPTFGRR